MSVLAEQTLPDAERELVTFLREQPELAVAVADRIYTTFPAQQDGSPLTLVVRRYGGEPVLGRPLVLDEATCQIEVYGGTKAQASNGAALVRALLAVRCASAVLGALRYVPDETFERPRPRYVLDVLLYVRPHGLTAAPSSRSLNGSALPAEQEGG